MLTLLGVTLLQPETVVEARVPGGAAALSALIDELRSGLARLYEGHQESGARSLCVALAPGGHFELWLTREDDFVPPEESAEVRNLAARLRPPAVLDGPVALALVFAIGAEAPAEAQLTLPDEWLGILRASDSSLSVEQILTRLWSLTA
jgi:hypothetical protein